jgi:hypothetical protein
MAHRCETAYTVGAILDRLDKHLLPGSRSRLENDAHRVAKSPGEAAAFLFSELAGAGDKYLREPDAIRNLARGERGLRFVIESLPIRAGARDKVFSETALELAELDPPQQAERLVDKMEERKNRDWHSAAPELPWNEKRCLSMLQSMTADLKPGTDVNALAREYQGSILGIDDRAAVEILASRVDGRGYSTREVDRVQALLGHESATDDSATDDELRSIYRENGLTL